MITLKKILAFLLAIMMLFSIATLLAGCDEGGRKKKSSSSKKYDDDDDDDDDDHIVIPDDNHENEVTEGSDIQTSIEDRLSSIKVYENESLMMEYKLKYENNRLASVVQYVDGESAETVTMTYNSEGKLVSKTTENSEELGVFYNCSYSYNDLGQLVSFREVNDYGGRLTKYEYDDSGRRLHTIVDYDNTIWTDTFFYGENGEIESVRSESKGKFDDYSSSSDAYYFYDSEGKLEKVTSNAYDMDQVTYYDYCMPFVVARSHETYEKSYVIMSISDDDGNDLFGFHLNNPQLEVDEDGNIEKVTVHNQWNNTDTVYIFEFGTEAE